MPADTAPLIRRPKAGPPAAKKSPCSKFNPFKKYAALKVLGMFLAAYIATMTFSPLGAIGSFGGFVS
eukprot:CAMPEP_0172550622 /NCGR_PEP_ID=MMETSP1067-20121228/30774_1 /TAXON_ID=265564 ORGANISM="Thalassiosira punctigera, Strain Tpunct2005C2" /NCGR_SAMPLE_ID=MMETSP1067 /ASSEMBLY_ACC=CAM_ASM_000444 /LENGTH=66 /DNA_ID=CAMNT_0013338241 /DNA_START=50 /DNA_END=247 /DNA_ORIENTATION=+